MSRRSTMGALGIICLMGSFLFSSASHAQQAYGLFMIVKGDVSFQNPNSALEKAKVGAKVLEGALISTEKDSRAKIVMSDRNVINLSPESKLTIQKYDSTAGKKNVSMSLEEGKARVNVEQKYDGNKEKFLLKTPSVVAGVRGTQFLASYNSTTRLSQIVTFKGTVTMTSFSDTGKAISTVTVEKGQTSSAGANQPPETPKSLPKEEIKDLDKSTASAGAETKKEKEAGKDAGASKAGKDANSSSETKGTEVKLANNQDLDTDLAKEIKVTPTETIKSAPLPPPPQTNLPRIIAPTDFARDAIQNQNSKTTVIIHVQ